MALLAGLLLPLAFAPFDLFPLALLSPLLLFLLLDRCSPTEGWWRGYLFGLGQFGFGASWVYVSIHDFGHAPMVLALLLTLLFIAFLAFFPALLGYLAARFTTAAPLRKYLLLLPCGWVALEWVRGWIMGGFPWLLLGQSQVDTPLVSYAPWLGVYGISLVVALSAGALALLRRSHRSAAIVLLLLLWLTPLLLQPMSWSTPQRSLRVSLVQGNIEQNQKWLAGMREETLTRYFDLSRAHSESDLIVWPETAIPAYFHWVEESFITPLEAFARESKTDFLIGVPVDGEAEGGYYNSIVSVGTQRGFYHKQHLVPFGEYLPFKPLLILMGNFLDVPMTDFSRGDERQPLLRVAGTAVGSSICYEAAFGEELIATLPEAELLVNVTNDAWFGRSLAPAQHLQIARMRAAETERYMLRAANTGISAIIGPDGELIAATQQFETTVLSGEVEALQGATPYVRWGNWPLLGLLLLGLLSLLKGFRPQPAIEER